MSSDPPPFEIQRRGDEVVPAREDGLGRLLIGRLCFGLLDLGWLDFRERFMRLALKLVASIHAFGEGLAGCFETFGERGVFAIMGEGDIRRFVPSARSVAASSCEGLVVEGLDRFERDLSQRIRAEAR